MLRRCDVVRVCECGVPVNDQQKFADLREKNLEIQIMEKYPK